MFERPPRPTRTATLFPAPTVLPSPMVSRLSVLRMPFGRADALPAPVVSAPQMMPPDGFNPLGSGPTEIRERPLCAELCWGDRWCSPDCEGAGYCTRLASTSAPGGFPAPAEESA